VSTGTFVAPLMGDRPITVGTMLSAPVVNVPVNATSGLLARSTIAVVSANVYVVNGTS
jgi:hypothetical protein